MYTQEGATGPQTPSLLPGRTPAPHREALLQLSACHTLNSRCFYFSWAVSVALWGMPLCPVEVCRAQLRTQAWPLLKTKANSGTTEQRMGDKPDQMPGENVAKQKRLHCGRVCSLPLLSGLLNLISLPAHLATHMRLPRVLCPATPAPPGMRGFTWQLSARKRSDRRTLCTQGGRKGLAGACCSPASPCECPQ